MPDEFRVTKQTDGESAFESCRNVGAHGSGVCPVCTSRSLVEIRGKLQCARCHTICETCCEGGRAS